ncbi:MAG: hypothetical protein IKJ73_07770 [Lachnospiraceae bacterium]|nr:hypothetical protein [Lachnospiraceae bacterium]
MKEYIIELGRKITYPFVKINEFVIDIRDRELPMTIGAVVGMVLQVVCIFADLINCGLNIGTIIKAVLIHLLVGLLVSFLAMAWDIVVAVVDVITYLPRHINKVCFSKKYASFKNNYTYNCGVGHKEKAKKEKYGLWYFIRKAKRKSKLGIRYIGA